MLYNWFDRIKKNIASIFLSQPYVISAITASVIILVLLLVLRENPPGPIKSIIIISWTVLCINSLRAFSQMVGQSIEERRSLERQERISYLKELITYSGIELFPVIVVFIISWIGIIDIYAAYKITIIIIMSLLFSYGYITLRYRSKNIILCILGGIFFVLTALSLVFMRMIINWFRYTL